MVDRMPIFRNKILALFLLVNIAIACTSLIVFANAISEKVIMKSPQQEVVKRLEEAEAIALIAAAVAVAGSTLASGIALSAVAKAGFAAYVERPDVKTWLLILGGLAEGIAIYGLLLGIMILGKI